MRSLRRWPRRLPLASCTPRRRGQTAGRGVLRVGMQTAIAPPSAAHDVRCRRRGLTVRSGHIAQLTRRRRQQRWRRRTPCGPTHAHTACTACHHQRLQWGRKRPAAAAQLDSRVGPSSHHPTPAIATMRVAVTTARTFATSATAVRWAGCLARHGPASPSHMRGIRRCAPCWAAGPALQPLWCCGATGPMLLPSAGSQMRRHAAWRRVAPCAAVDGGGGTGGRLSGAAHPPAPSPIHPSQTAVGLQPLRPPG